VPDESDPDAPGDGGDHVAGGRCAVEEPTQGFDDRCEGLVLRELPDAGPIFSAGTIALLKNGSMTSGTAARPAVSGD
jgi:hypothetical protein